MMRKLLKPSSFRRPCCLEAASTATPPAPVLALGVPGAVLANGETHDWLFVTPDTLHYWPQIDQELGI